MAIFEASDPAPIDGVIECANITIVDDGVLDGDEQDFTVDILSVEYPMRSADNIMCVTNCTASVTLMDNAADCK